MHHQTRSTRRVASVLVAAVVALALTACDPTPDQDDFYQSLPSTAGKAPGDVLRSRESKFRVVPGIGVPGAKSTQILYRSTGATGRANVVSGTVITPATPFLGLGPRPVVAMAAGTRGLGDKCAPSYTLSQGTDYEGAIVAMLLGLGYAVAVTDYEGLGTPGQHTYVIGKSEGPALLDVARAAQRLGQGGVTAQSPVGIMGYSQGGGAAGWAAQMAPSYAPELNIKGVAAGGVPADLTEVAEFNEGGVAIGVVLMAAVGLDTAYPELNLPSLLNDRGRDTLAKAENLCLVSFSGLTTLAGTVFKSRGDYVTTDPLSLAPWKARLAENRLGAVAPQAPVFQYHAKWDEIVPFDQAKTLNAEWCAKGAKVKWQTLPGEHLLGGVEGEPAAVAWMALRMTGVPAGNDC